MNPALRSAEAAFRTVLDGYTAGRAPRLLAITRCDDIADSAVARFRADFRRSSIQILVPFAEQFGWPEPSFAEFSSLYESLAQPWARVALPPMAIEPAFLPGELTPSRDAFSDCRAESWQGLRERYLTELPAADWRHIVQGHDLAAAGEHTAIQVMRNRNVLLRPVEYDNTPRVSFRGIPVRVVHELVNRGINEPVSILPGQVSYVEHYGRSPFVAANEVHQRQIEAMERMMSANNDLLDAMTQQFAEGITHDVISTIFYEVDPGTAEERKAATARAEELMRSWLTPAQLEDLDKHGHFHVVGGDSGKRYRIMRGRQMNVIELDAGDRPLIGRCFVPGGSLAEGDVMLGQKVSLETRELHALKESNAFEVGRSTPQRRAVTMADWGERMNGFGFATDSHLADLHAAQARSYCRAHAAWAAEEMAQHARHASEAAARASAAPAIGEVPLMWTAVIGLAMIASFIFYTWPGH